MHLRIEYILKKQLRNKLKGTTLKETVHNCNVMLINYASFEFEHIKKPFIICDHLIYTNTLDLGTTYRAVTINEFKDIINSYIETRELEDITFIINYCL